MTYRQYLIKVGRRRRKKKKKIEKYFISSCLHELKIKKKGEKLTKIGALSFSSVTYMTSVDVDDLANGIIPLSVAVTITE